MLMFKYIIANRWRRVKPQGDGVTESTEPRPHIIATTEEAAKLIIVDSVGFVGNTGLCPGQVWYDDGTGAKWHEAYRWRVLSEEHARELIRQLTEQLEAIRRAARD